MKTIITGASGFAGSYFNDFYKQKGDRTIGTTHSKKLPGLMQIDLTQDNLVNKLLMLERPNVVIHCAAMANVDYCEENPIDSYRANVIATKNLVSACERVGSKLVFLSSDYVFNGRDRPDKGYSEIDAPDPINIYGQHKLEAEKLVLENPNNLVARTTVVYGWEKGVPKNFFHTLVNGIRSKRERLVPVDQEGSPTYVVDLVKIIDELIQQGKSGIYHVSGPKIVSRYQFAMNIAWMFGAGDYELLKTAYSGNSNALPNNGPMKGINILNQKAPRGLKLGMDISKITKTVQHQPLSPLEALMKLKKEGR